MAVCKVLTTKFLVFVVLTIVLKKRDVVCQQFSTLNTSPCPDILKFVQEYGNVVAYLKIYYPQQNVNRLDIEFMLVSNSEGYGKLSLVDTNKKITTNIINGEPVYYRLEFPPWEEFVQPKVTKIWRNNELICGGPPVGSEFVYPGRITRTIKLSNTFTINGSFINSVQRPTFYQTPAPPPRTMGRPPVLISRIPFTTPPSTTTTTTTRRTTTTTTAMSSTKPPKRQEEVQCGVPSEINHLVIGGTEVPAGKYPWLGVMYVRAKLTAGYNYQCVGNLVSNNHIITAGHCTDHSGTKRSVNPDDMIFALGLHNIDEFPTSTVNVQVRQIWVHPDYEYGSGDADVAIIILQKTVTFSSIIRPICLWPNRFGSGVVGEKGVVAGWGLDETSQLSALPKEISLPIVSNEVCLRASPGFNFITSDRTLCAGDKSGVGPCNGDSGSGLILRRGSQWYIRGIVSATLRNSTTGYCDLSNYVVFTDLAKFDEWVQQRMS